MLTFFLLWAFTLLKQDSGFIHFSKLSEKCINLKLTWKHMTIRWKSHPQCNKTNAGREGNSDCSNLTGTKSHARGRRYSQGAAAVHSWKHQKQSHHLDKHLTV